MPRIFDNIEQKLLPTLAETLNVASNADFCVGYFNLRGWKQIDSYVEKWSGGEGQCCRLLVGMQRLPQEELRQAAVDTLNRQLRSGISDPALAELCIALREEDRLCIIHEEEQTLEPTIICSMGLVSKGAG